MEMKTGIFTVVSVLLLLMETVNSQADVYSPPMTWLPMSMPSITYDSSTNKLAVQSKPAVTLGTNVSPITATFAPGIGIFDPTRIWSALNGTAFSRQLGWNDPNYDYVLPPDTSPTSVLFPIHELYGPGACIWIESLSKSPGLNTYLAVGMWGVNADDTLIVDYANPSGVPYSGIFGTDGSSGRWHWDGFMDHNVSTVSFSYLNASSQLFTATYRLYIGDAEGNELLVDKNGNSVSSASTTTAWQWLGPAFVFTSRTGVAPSTLVESSPLRLTALGAVAQDISISGGEYAISTTSAATAPADGEWNAWTGLPGTISNNYWVKVRQSSAPEAGMTTLAALAIPALAGTGTFKVTTDTPEGFTTTVPNVIGATHSAARTAITEASLNVASIGTQHSNTVPAGSVISQNPAAGSLFILNVDPVADPNPAVDLLVSLGPATVTVPDIVGLTQTEAALAVTTAGMSVGDFTLANSDTVQAGLVISQSPLPGTSTTSVSAVQLTVSLGPVATGTVDLPSSSLLSDAYAAVSTGYSIKMRDTTFVGTASFTLDKAVYLRGGFNESFTTNNGYTILNGVLNIAGGSLTLENIVIE
jgi:beta-lactam-binding protein with PASTA domain